jgi:gluconolactonase
MTARFETLCFGYGLVEGPRACADGSVVFSDALGGGVYRWRDGAVETVVPKRRGIGGIVLHEGGGLVVTGRDVVHVRDGATRVLFAADGAAFNDLTTDRAGRVYVGSLRSPALEDGPDRVPGECWRLDAAGSAVRLYDDVAFANGIGFSPDERVLYHSNYSRREVLAHDVDADGRATGRRVFATVPRGNPDGLAVDEAGCVWVALGGGGALARLTPAGAVDRVLEVPSPFVAGCCFGGADRRDLYVATMGNAEDAARGGTLFRTRVDVAGLMAPPARI